MLTRDSLLLPVASLLRDFLKTSIARASPLRQWLSAPIRMRRVSDDTGLFPKTHPKRRRQVPGHHDAQGVFRRKLPGIALHGTGDRKEGMAGTTCAIRRTRLSGHRYLTAVSRRTGGDYDEAIYQHGRRAKASVSLRSVLVVMRLIDYLETRPDADRIADRRLWAIQKAVWKHICGRR